jgi:hypothetical protein
MVEDSEDDSLSERVIGSGVKVERKGSSEVPFATCLWYALGFNNMPAEGAWPFGAEGVMVVGTSKH